MAEKEQVRKKLAIIDGKSVFYRGYYAMPNLATKDGTPTGGVYGFAVLGLELIKKMKPDYVAVAWDKPKTNIRSRLAIYPEYKAGRKPAPPDFYDQIPVLHDLLEAFGWPLYELDDYEADDIMGALAIQAREKNIETMLITSDLDVLQLVNGHVHAYALKKGFSNIEEFSEESFKAKYGIDVHQFIDLKALKGDSSDNIPGVAGIGEKTAVGLLQQFKTLDGVYENLGLIKDSVRAKLEAGRDMAYLSKKLVTLMTDAPIKLNLKEVDGTKADPERIRDTLQRLEFRSLVRQLPDIMKLSDEPVHQVQSDVKLQIGKNVIIDTADKLGAFATKHSKPSKTPWAIHSRSIGKHGQGPIVLVLSPSPDEVFTFDLTKLNLAHVAKALEPILAEGEVIGFDTKACLKVLINLGVGLPKITHDALMGSFLLNPLRREKTLTELAQADLGYEGPDLDELDEAELIGRAPEIIGLIRAMCQEQAAALGKLPKVSDVAQKIDYPVIPVLAKMEYAGIELNTEVLADMAERTENMISDIEQEIYGHADQEFNIGSPSQLADILFGKLNLPSGGIKRGKTGYSTAASELDKLRGQHPIIDLITRYREVTKLKNTYIDTLPNQVDENSRLHTTFAMNVAQTGRLSSHDPNLQNIPVRSDLGKEIRAAFVPAKEHVFVSADYSQFELRLAAYLSDDKDLIDQFNRDVDVHTATAAQVYERDPEDVTKNMRRDAKAVNFGIMYGLSTHGLVQGTGMTYEQAKHFIDKYFEVRPKLLGYIESIKKQAVEEGYVETMYGRRRPTPDVKSSNFMVREAGLRAAVNMPFQGSAADIMKLAMIEVDKKLEGSDCKLLLQIHDSILVECPESSAKKTAVLLKETMENVVKLPIKLTVDTSVGKNWGEI